MKRPSLRTSVPLGLALLAALTSCDLNRLGTGTRTDTPLVRTLDFAAFDAQGACAPARAPGSRSTPSPSTSR
ncbi:hypothetical protein [Deinococcus reticulitermitis]|uniref:hypothetical protein n=1 Tax=Deinococcus reticulitermitis TaxID=856736 RepID=UPI0011607F35|nr:hypothetical protein [Deinococcus reticulitermitis]